MKRWATIPILLIFGVLLAPSAVFGQGATTATIRGQVTDANGQPLPGANVLAVHVPSGTRYGASTNESGRYTLANLRPGGPYRVSASFVGYQSKREEGL
ncbi:MAG: carboxypeptidase-like regulatory domain-containing protein, partial [Salinibacter sp.]